MQIFEVKGKMCAKHNLPIGYLCFYKDCKEVVGC